MRWFSGIMKWFQLRKISEELAHCTRLDEMPRRVELCRRALELVERERNPKVWAALQVNLSSSLAQSPSSNRAENLEKAIAGYQTALEVLTREATPVEWAGTQMSMATAYLERIQGEPAENQERAIASYEAALEVATRDAMPTLWVQAKMSLAGAYIRRMRGEPAENQERAIASCEAALGVLTRKSTPVEWALMQSTLATTYLERIRGERAENLERAIAGCEAALEVRTREAMPVEWSLTEMNLASAFACRIRGERAENLERAIAGYEKTLEVRTREAMPVEWAETQMNLANAYFKRMRGEPAENQERAIASLQEALEVRTRETMPVEWAQTETNLALCYRERIRGDPAENLERAIRAFEEALEVRTREAMPVEWAETQMNLAGAYLRMQRERAEDLERAIAHYEAALEVMTREAMPVDWALTQMGLANAYAERIQGERAKNRERAFAHFEAALEVMTREAMPAEHLVVQLNLGRLLFEDSRWNEACSTFGEAVETEELLYQTAATPEARQAELREVRGLPARFTYALARKGDLGEALVALERGRARGLAEALALDEAPLNRLLPEEREAFDGIRARIHLLQTEARLPEGTPAKRSFIAISEELRAAYANLKRLIAEIREHFPEFLPETSFSDIQTAASWAPLVYVLATEAGGLALLLPDPSAGVVPVWLPELTGKSVRERWKTYFEANSAWRIAPGDDESKRQAWFLALDDTTHWLWQVAMGPIIEVLGHVHQAVLIPTGLISLLPLHAAWKNDSTKPTGRRYALDSLILRYVPSAKSLCAAHEVATSTVPNTLLAIDEPEPVSGDALPSSGGEVLTAICSFPDHHVLRHEQATREAVRDALPRHTVLHFACHGSADFRQPLNSGLAMANYQSLTLRDFLDLHLPGARLAVLSACDTGLPGTELPDEVLSLPAGLLQAGVAGIAASLWSVADISTMVLMSRFYELWQKGTREPAEALQEAQQWMSSTANRMKLAEYYEKKFELSQRSDPDAFAWMTYYRANPEVRPFTHPYFWAGFFFTGV